MNYDGHFTRLSSDECRQLVRACSVGRVGWNSRGGVQILPVTYRVTGDLIAFRARPDSIMGELRAPLEVSFQIDDIDEDTATGWSVQVRGRAVGYLDQPPTGVDLPQPWAPGPHPMVVIIEPMEYSGRAVSAMTSGDV